jgi:hypothetical protein
MPRTLLHAACLLCLSCLFCAAPAFAQDGQPWPDPTGIPAASDADIAAAVELAGGNRAELEAALSYFPAGSTELAALRFIVANLPLADLGCITSAELANNVELALDAWRGLPFEPFYDGATWAHYVLPHRVSQEPLEPWRSEFHSQLAPLVAECATPEEAWRVVFDWCGQRAGFKQTQRRDQGPLTTIKGGYGRCEELMALQICALRSVGLPARNVSVPWWSHQDNNHAWTEVLHPDGRWGLPWHSWEQDAARQAAVVVGMCYGLPEDSVEDVLAKGVEPGARWCQMNSITNYRTPARLRLDFSQAIMPTDGDAPPPEGWQLSVYVWNYGALRRVCRTAIEPDGSCALSLGAGVYVLGTDVPGTSGLRLVELTGTDTLIASWERLVPVSGEMLVEYPKSAD